MFSSGKMVDGWVSHILTVGTSCLDHKSNMHFIAKYVRTLHEGFTFAIKNIVRVQKYNLGDISNFSLVIFLI